MSVFELDMNILSSSIDSKDFFERTVQFTDCNFSFIDLRNLIIIIINSNIRSYLDSEFLQNQICRRIKYDTN